MKEKWSYENIPDLTEKIMIITGGNSGLGLEAAKAFSGKGAETIIACRNLTAGEAAKAAILLDQPQSIIEVMELDLMDLQSIRRFAGEYKKKYAKLDVLLNNAGIMTVPYGHTKDGFESQVGTNHLGHFALTGLLIDLIINTPHSRVVSVSSKAHTAGKMDFEDLLYENGQGYTPMKAYGRSKLANLLFTFELQRKFEAAGRDSIAVAAHPGISKTNLARHIENKWYIKLFSPLLERIGQSAAMGALPEIRATVDPDVKGGEYYGPAGTQEMKGYPVLVESSKASHNEADALKLWQISKELTNVHFEFNK